MESVVASRGQMSEFDRVLLHESLQDTLTDLRSQRSGGADLDKLLKVLDRSYSHRSQRKHTVGLVRLLGASSARSHSIAVADSPPNEAADWFSSSLPVLSRV